MTWSREGDLLQRSCMPMLYVEISCGALCVGGFAAIGCKMLSEPLMQPLQVYRSNCQKHMLALGRTMAAIRLTLGSLAAEQQAAFTAISPELHWAGRPWLLCQGAYETWTAETLWGDTIYLLTRQQAAAGSQSAKGVAAGAGTQPGKLVAKFWQPQDDDAVGDYVQRAWHEQGGCTRSGECVIVPCAKERTSAVHSCRPVAADMMLDMRMQAVTCLDSPIGRMGL